MKSYTNSTFDHEVVVLIPESVEEFDQNAKRAGACLEEATMNVIYRGWNATFRSAFLARLVKETGFTRPTEPTGSTRKVVTKNSDGTETTSEEPVFKFKNTDLVDYRALRAMVGERDRLSDEQVVERFQPIADEVARGIAFDASEQERAARAPKKLPDWVVKLVEKIKNQGRDSIVATDLSNRLGYTVTTDNTDLARGIVEDQRRKQAEREKEYI